MAEHLCYDGFWGPWAPELVDLLNQVAPADAVNMSLATYTTLVATLRNIESALDLPAAPVDAHQGLGTAFPPDHEALLRAMAQQLQAGMSVDRFDGGAGCHNPLPPGWIRTGSPQKVAVDAVRVLKGGAGGPVPPFCPPDGVMGRIRAALDSSYVPPPP